MTPGTHTRGVVGGVRCEDALQARVAGVRCEVREDALRARVDRV